MSDQFNEPSASGDAALISHLRYRIGELASALTASERMCRNQQVAALKQYDRLARERDTARFAQRRTERGNVQQTIDWKRVDERLRCPKCGDPAHIDAETDGTQASHVHRFKLSREEALRLSLPTVEEAAERIPQLEAELAELKNIIKENQHG